jgi:hypothetical protein
VKHFKRYKPYIRRANGREKAESLRIAFRLAFYQEMGRPFYVMVQRGWPNLAIAVGKSKRELKRTPIGVRLKKMSYRTWSRHIQRCASKRNFKVSL